MSLSGLDGVSIPACRRSATFPFFFVFSSATFPFFFVFIDVVFCVAQYSFLPEDGRSDL